MSNASSLQVHLNTKIADLKVNGTMNSDLLFYLKEPVIPPQGKNMTLLLKACSIPVSFYLVNSTNNTLVINTSTFTLTQGNYTAYTLLDLLNTTLNPTYVVTLNTTTNKYTTSSLTSFTLKSTSTCQRLLGFASGTDYTSTASTLTSVYPVDLSGDNMIYISTPNILTQNRLGGQKSTILRAVPVSVSYGSVLFFDDNSGAVGSVIQEDHIGFIHLRIYSEDATLLLDFQNADWSISLEVGFVDKTTQPVPGKSMREVFDNYASEAVRLKSTNY